MPVVQPPLDLVKAIEKEVKGDNDGDTLSDILDRLAESTGVTMEFIVGSPAGKVVKGLRAHQDERVRSKAVKLTAAWKVLVSKTLSSNKVAKEIRKTGETAAADGVALKPTVFRCAHDTDPPWAGCTRTSLTEKSPACR
jgi:hypothetical protein